MLTQKLALAVANEPSLVATTPMVARSRPSHPGPPLKLLARDRNRSHQLRRAAPVAEHGGVDSARGRRRAQRPSPTRQLDAWVALKQADNAGSETWARTWLGAVLMPRMATPGDSRATIAPTSPQSAPLCLSLEQKDEVEAKVCA